MSEPLICSQTGTTNRTFTYRGHLNPDLHHENFPLLDRLSYLGKLRVISTVT